MRRIKGKIEWSVASDIAKRIKMLTQKMELDWIDISRIFTYRSVRSKTRAYARTWGLPSLWQRALDVKPGYIIEVISEHFDKLSTRDKDKVLLHELTHIPRNFSGALVPHTHKKKGSFKHKLDELISRYFENS
jgi:predicted metallopeptidase